MNSVALSPLSKALRKPYYWFWRVVEHLFYAGRTYTLSVPFGQRVLAPWFGQVDAGFDRALRAAREAGPVAVSPDRCYILYALARNALALDGDFAECGVYTGGTANLLAHLLAEQDLHLKRLHLFDTFAGMPDISVPTRDYHNPGDFADTSLSFVRKRLGAYGKLCQFHVGTMPQTFVEVQDVQSYAFVHIDVDIYPSALECCQWFYPRMAFGGVIVFDDYGFFPYRNAIKAAVDEFCSAIGVFPIVLPTGQSIIVKTQVFKTDA